MIDYVLSNSKWYDDTLPTGMIYHGPVLRVGSPRCDILVNDRTEIRKKVRGSALAYLQLLPAVIHPKMRRGQMIRPVPQVQTWNHECKQDHGTWMETAGGAGGCLPLYFGVLPAKQQRGTIEG